jgi:hypothetical protein
MQVSLIKNRWRENFDMFVNGTRNEDKMDWQTNFSVNKFATTVRTAQGRLVNTLVNNPDWYELCPRSYYNKEAEVLAPAFKKALDYYLEAAKFKRHSSTFMLCALISSGAMHIGWKQRLVQNPEYILEKTEKERRKIQERLAKHVVNPQFEDEALAGDELEERLAAAVDEVMAEAQGLDAPKKKTEPYIQIGCLDLMDINHERQYWDPNCMYMEDSPWRAFEYDVNRYELHQMVRLGLIDKDRFERIGSMKDMDARTSTRNIRYQNTINGPQSRTDLVKLTVYAGPLIVNNKVEKDRYFALIANDSVLLVDSEYPFWEPPGHNTSVITASVRQVPYRSTGAGIGDQAVPLQKIYDSNWQLVCDTFRFGIAGVNVVNWQNLIDKGQLHEGLYPGMTLEVRGSPEESFKHIPLTSNLENQAHPVQNMLEQAMDSLTGINELMTGGSNPFSRTAAAETNARLDAGNQNVNIIALDLEQYFLIPALEKCFARVLQFGIPELNSNPELKALLTEEEQYALQQLSARGRMEVLNQWYTFKIKGFSAATDKNEQAMRDNELMQIINSGGVLSQLINLPEFLKRYFKNRDIKDPEKLLMVTDSPLAQVTAENQSLLSNHMVMPSPNDDHEFHLQMQGQLAQSPFATPELQQHVMMHQQAVQQMQMMQQAQAQQGQGQPPIQ